MKNIIRIGLMDESNQAIKTIKRMLSDVVNYRIIFEVWNRQELMNKLKLHSVDLLLINFQMTLLAGARSIQAIKNNSPNLKIILTALYNQPSLLYKYMEMGINGLALKQFNSYQICKTIEGVSQLGYYYSETILNSISKFQIKSDLKKPIPFTDKELRIIKCICNEMTSTEMGNKLFLSCRTIDWYRTNIKKKIGTKSSIGVVKFAIAHGLYTV